MNIEIPVAPLGVLALLSFFAPYAIGLLNGVLPFVTKPWQRKVVAIVVSAALTAIVLVFYYAITGEVVPAWPALTLLALVIASASYALVTGNSAEKLEQKVTPEG